MRRWHNGRTVERAVEDEHAATRCSWPQAWERVIGVDPNGDADDARLALALGRRVLDDIKAHARWSQPWPERLRDLNLDAMTYLRRLQEGL